MSKSALLAQADAEFNRLFGEHNPIPNPRTSLDTCQGLIGGAAYVDPVVFPCCCFHADHGNTEGVARGQIPFAKASSDE
jgi:hypothetical protein